MTGLVVLALLWLGLHVGVAGTGLRDVLVRRVGERGFRGAFTLLSVLVLAAFAFAYHRTPGAPLWSAPGWLVWLLDLAMLPAALLFVASLTASNPTMADTEGAYGSTPRGIFRVTRHPMLCSFAIWASVHLLANGDAASLVFFGTILLTVLAGIPSIDGKLARRDPAKWAALAGATSRVPFAAALSGRNRFVPGEIGWKTPLIGAALWVAMLALHPAVIGVSALPG